MIKYSIFAAACGVDATAPNMTNSELLDTLAKPFDKLYNGWHSDHESFVGSVSPTVQTPPSASVSDYRYLAHAVHLHDSTKHSSNNGPAQKYLNDLKAENKLDGDYV